MNWYYLCCVLVLSAGGIPKGYDEGGFSASVRLPSFKNDFDLNSSSWKGNASGLANRLANITSFGVLGAAFGSLLAVPISDRLGRLKCWRFFILLWFSGTLVQVFSSGIYGLLLTARIWSGLGSGGLTVIAPLFLSEIAPARSRGRVVSLYMVVLLSFLSIGFFVSYGASKGMSITRAQYRLVQAIPLIPCGLAFLGSFFLADSPRWLAARGRREEALTILSRLRAGVPHRNVAFEVDAMEEQFSQHSKMLEGTSTLEILKDIARTPTYRKRFLLAIIMQTVAQWSGGNGITYYVPQIFSYAGVDGDSQTLVASGAYGIVKLVFTMIFAWGLVDVFGRRISMVSGIFIQLAAHIYMAVYMSSLYENHNKNASNAAIASIFVYAVGWSIGLCTVQYLYATEIFNTRIRGVCYAINMAVHWFFQFAVVRVTPNILVAFHVWGAFVFWACVCAAGLVVLGLMAPETKGIPMEMMEELFKGPWYSGWKAKVVLPRQDDETLSEPAQTHEHIISK